MSEQRTTLGHLARDGYLEFGDGYRTKRAELADKGFAIIRAGDIVDSTVTLHPEDHISFNYRQAIGAKLARPGDVLLTTKGTVGRRAIVPFGIQDAAYSPQICYFRPDPTGIWPRFFFYWLGSAEFGRQASHLQHATDMAPYISLSQLSQTEISLPPLPEQQAIAEVLGALDDKIAANDQLTQHLDHLAQLRTRRALVSFEPRTVGSIAEVIMGSSPTGDSYNEDGVGTVLYQGNRDFGFRSPSARVWTTAPERLGQAGDILVSVRAPVGQVNIADGEVCIGRGVAALRCSATYALFHILQVSRTAFSPFEASGTVFGSINGRELRELNIPVPSAGLQALNREIRSSEEAVSSLIRESRTLASLRDTLLPALMSGRLRVRDAEAQVSEVL